MTMTTPRKITIALFLIAITLYVIAPALALGLVLIGMLFEIAGWISLFKDYKQSKEKRT